ncbi:DUF3592 domain-containing protein [Hymenobacter jeollabukensis]|uniref:DUF3592 domain-containing protein n=1 Tax=Hymenobacter jeollabukensis TaxID=2025313 RepID=A0A5R8WMX1_9BACT|nr:DUF3592 domain-containing protein [Hymenobacter jeollabukensis]TLM91054.1 DUF3592 domain-containing protein [Hymenobacter jeollabukensis]
MTAHPLTGPYALIFALGLGLVLAGAHLLLHSSQLRRRGRHVWGRVTGIETSPARTLVSFHTLEGQAVTVSSRYRLPPGAAVPLYYDPAQPAHVAIDSLLYRRWPYLLIGLGLVIIPLAWLL